MIHTLSKIAENPVTIGAVGVGTVQMLAALPIHELGQLVIQVIVGIATIVKLLRNKKPKSE